MTSFQIKRGIFIQRMGYLLADRPALRLWSKAAEREIYLRAAIEAEMGGLARHFIETCAYHTYGSVDGGGLGTLNADATSDAITHLHWQRAVIIARDLADRTAGGPVEWVDYDTIIHLL